MSVMFYNMLSNSINFPISIMIDRQGQIGRVFSEWENR